VSSRSAQLLNLEETALILGIGRSTIYRAVRDGKVPFPVHRIGERWYVPKRALERFLDGEGNDAEAHDDAQQGSSRSRC
jgi:excisionase family DNA binding protein